MDGIWLPIDEKRPLSVGDFPEEFGTCPVAIPPFGETMRLEIDLVAHHSTDTEPRIQGSICLLQIIHMLKNGLGINDIHTALIYHSRVLRGTL